MARLEAAKCQNFAPETLEVFFRAFTLERWTNRKFLDRVAAVLKMPQVRREVTIDDFFNAPPASDHEVLDDARWLAEKQRQDRLAKMREMRTPEEEIRKSGWLSLQQEAELRFAEAIEHIEKELLDRSENARRLVGQMTDRQLYDVYLHLVTTKHVRPVDTLIDANRELLRGWMMKLFPRKSRFDFVEREFMRTFILTNPYELVCIVEAMTTSKKPTTTHKEDHT